MKQKVNCISIHQQVLDQAKNLVSKKGHYTVPGTQNELFHVENLNFYPVYEFVMFLLNF